MSVRRFVVGAVSLLALAGTACGPSQAQQVPSAPVGAIAGKVTSLKDGTALGGVNVSVIQVNDKGEATSLAVSTGADGSFVLNALPAGTSYRVRFALDGFVPRFRDVDIPAAAGNYPQGNGVGEANIALAPATGGVSGKVLASGAKAASGAKLGIDLRPANFDFVAEAVANANGEYTFSGLPGAPTGVPVTVVVQPFDEDNDTRADYGVLEVNTLSFPGVSTRTDIDLRTAAEALVLLGSDLDDGEQPAADAIHLTFNRAIAPSSLEVTLTDVDHSRTVGASAVVSSGTVVTVTTSGGPLSEGTHYQLSVDARAFNGAGGSFNRYFRAVAGNGGTLPSVGNLTVNPDMVDWNTNAFTLKWDMVTGAQAYRVFAKDNKKNTAYVLVKTVGSSPNPQASITLPPEFDTFTGDSVQTPFAFKTGVDFAVVAVNALGDAAAPGTGSVHKDDNTPGTVTGVQQTDGADNSMGATPKNVELHVSYSEYVDTSNPPQILLPQGLTSAFEADSTLLGGKFVIVVPPGVNASGSFKITNAYDTSGNSIPDYDGTLTAISELLTNTSFEGCSLAGWTALTTGSTSTPATTMSTAASGTCAVDTGHNSFTYGDSYIAQTVSLPSTASNITFSVKYNQATDYPFAGHDYAYCVLQNTFGTNLQTLFTDYSNQQTWLTATANITGFAGQTVRIYCAAHHDGSHTSGAYFDDVSVTITQ